MLFKNGLFTSESVAEGHPDKVCDQISDAILDEFLTLDPNARAACETFAMDGKVIVAGEFRTADPEHFDAVQDAAEGIVRQTLHDVGYCSSEYDIDPDKCLVEISLNHQSEQIAAGVDQSASVIGAGDQGMMFGFACDETETKMPLPTALSHELLIRLASLRRQGELPWLKADAKSQVSVFYSDGAAEGVGTVVLSAQHAAEIPLAEVRRTLTRQVIDPVIPASLRMRTFKLYINPAGSWTIGGPKGDTGLTGRKIIVDTYGGACPHGGGAFSGKDATKVDRSAAYMARYLAKHVVVAGLARRCSIQLAYAIGRPDPVSVNVDLHGTGSVDSSQLVSALQAVFDLTPARIIEELELTRPIFKRTACYGHFGREEPEFLWESTPRISQLLEQPELQ